MKRLLSKRVIAAFCLLLLVLFLLRPGVGWMRTRVSNSIAQGLGRNVQIGAVRLRFLPRPGFEMDDLIVRDDPAFGSEPLVRASEVDAAISLSALVRGRIEIARLSLTEASINLTRNAQGRWNLEDLIDRTARTSLAPTGSAARSQGPSFPYIEATGARVNLKLGSEKTHFALTNADFALWQESKDTWGARLRARPIRTDANLTDTGVINANGLWRRAAQLHQTPIQVSFQWKQAQIGQVSTLVFGTEKNWRGDALLSGSLFGTPAKLKFVADASVSDFRRENVIGGGNLRLAAHCTADLALSTREIAGLDCTGPIGGGFAQVKGSASGILLDGQPFSSADLWVVMSHVPAASLVNTLHHANPEFPQDVKIGGDVTSAIRIQRSNQHEPVSIQGSGSIDGTQIASNDMDPVTIGAVPFTITNAAESGTAENSQRHSRKAGSSNPQPQGLRAELGPLNLAPGKLGPLTAQATITREGFAGSARGDTGLGRLLQAAKALRIPAPAINGDGAASVNLRVSGAWLSGEKPLVTGTARLRSVHAQMRGLNAPIEALSADLVVDADAVTVQNLTGNVAGSTWRGSLRILRPCANPGDCELQFKLRADKLSAGALNTLLNPSARPKAWYRFLSLGGDQPSYLLQTRATGKIAVDNLAFGSTSCTHFVSDLSLNAGKVELSNFKAECLQGNASGAWTAEFSAKPPKYSGNGSFDRVSLADIAELMHDGWVEGTGSATYEFQSAGLNIQQVLNSADVSAHFKVSGGTFLHVVLARGSGPLRANDFTGTLRLAEQSFSLRDAKLTNGNDVYTVSGTASLGGALDLRVVNGSAASYAIGGSLAKTRVSAIPNAEASLKP